MKSHLFAVVLKSSCYSYSPRVGMRSRPRFLSDGEGYLCWPPCMAARRRGLKRECDSTHSCLFSKDDMKRSDGGRKSV